jgi:hypothetical protein
MCILSVAKSGKARAGHALPADIEDAVVSEEHRLKHSIPFGRVLKMLIKTVEPLSARQSIDPWCQNCTRLTNVQRNPILNATHEYVWEYWET